MGGSIRIIGVGATTPPPDQLVSTEEVFRYLRSHGVTIEARQEQTIVEAVDIRSRWNSSLTTSELEVLAAKDACSNAQILTPEFKPKLLQLIHACSSTPGKIIPPSACVIQHALGIPGMQCEARDITAGCCSWTEGVVLADARMRQANYRYGLVAAGEVTYSRANPPTSLEYALWDDGGAAVVLKYDPTGDPELGIIAARSVSDGANAHLLEIKGLGTDYPAGTPYDAGLQGRGRLIQRFCLEHVPSFVVNLLKEQKLEIDDRTFFLPHNANLRMVRQLAKSIGIPEERTLTLLGDRGRGNQSSASIPATVAHFAHLGRFTQGDLLIMVAFGAGMILSCIVYRWP